MNAVIKQIDEYESLVIDDRQLHYKNGFHIITDLTKGEECIAKLVPSTVLTNDAGRSDKEVKQRY